MADLEKAKWDYENAHKFAPFVWRGIAIEYVKALEKEVERCRESEENAIKRMDEMGAQAAGLEGERDAFRRDVIDYCRARCVGAEVYDGYLIKCPDPKCHLQKWRNKMVNHKKP